MRLMQPLMAIRHMALAENGRPPTAKRTFVGMYITPSEQIERIRVRNGEYMLGRFINEWIPMENRYFDYFGIKNKCHFTI